MPPACLIISYARKDNVLQLVNKVIDSGALEIYISIDGPRNQSVKDIQSVLKLKLDEKQADFLGRIHIWQRKSNMGSGASVIASLDWVFASEEEAVILEDDLEISGEFYGFMKFGLKEMKNHENLKIVTGTNPFEDVTKNQLGKLSYPVSWGWATNRNNWQELRTLVFEGTTAKSTPIQSNKDLYWRIGRKRSLLGQIEAWDIPLASEMYKTPFYTLIPSINLVRNIGFDQYAEHTNEKIWPLNIPISKNSQDLKFKLDSNQLVDLNGHFEKYIFRIRKHHMLSWILHKTTDRYRFKSNPIVLLERTQLEDYPSS